MRRPRLGGTILVWRKFASGDVEVRAALVTSTEDLPGEKFEAAIVLPGEKHITPIANPPYQDQASTSVPNGVWFWCLATEDPLVVSGTIKIDLHLDANSIPRRQDLLRMEPAEKAIRDAMVAVEEMGAAPILTEAGILLDQALRKVGDWVDVQIDAQPMLLFGSRGASPLEKTAAELRNADAIEQALADAMSWCESQGMTPTMYLGVWTVEVDGKKTPEMTDEAFLAWVAHTKALGKG